MITVPLKETYFELYEVDGRAATFKAPVTNALVDRIVD
jgi:hypothetical protein